MLDLDTFITILYVTIDDECKSALPQSKPTGRPASLSATEILTLGIVGQWAQFKSERDFYRYVERHLRPAFPTLPARSQFNRLLRSQHDALVAVSQLLLTLMEEWHGIYELLDSTAAPVRDSRRRGGSWVAGQADYGWSNRLGWYYGFHVLVSITPSGLITGFGFSSANTHDHKLLQTFLAARAFPQERLLSVGSSEQHTYIGDKGFAGKRVHEQWKWEWGATVITASHPNYKRERQWSREERRWRGLATPGHRECLWQAAQFLWARARTTSCPFGVSGTPGSKSRFTQLLLLAQSSLWPRGVSLRRFTRLVI